MNIQNYKIVIPTVYVNYKDRGIFGDILDEIVSPILQGVLNILKPELEAALNEFFEILSVLTNAILADVIDPLMADFPNLLSGLDQIAQFFSMDHVINLFKEIMSVILSDVSELASDQLTLIKDRIEPVTSYLSKMIVESGNAIVYNLKSVTSSIKSFSSSCEIFVYNTGTEDIEIAKKYIVSIVNTVIKDLRNGVSSMHENVMSDLQYMVKTTDMLFDNIANTLNTKIKESRNTISSVCNDHVLSIERYISAHIDSKKNILTVIEKDMDDKIYEIMMYADKKINDINNYSNFIVDSVKSAVENDTTSAKRGIQEIGSTSRNELDAFKRNVSEKIQWFNWIEYIPIVLLIVIAVVIIVIVFVSVKKLLLVSDMVRIKMKKYEV